MVIAKWTWREKHLAKEEDNAYNSDNYDMRQEREVSVSKACGNITNNQSDVGTMEVNMVLVISDEFHAPEREVVKLALGVERVVFEKPEKAGEHMGPLFIK
jgi:hypothetical protein